MYLRCENGHDLAASHVLEACPHPGCGAPVWRVKENGDRWPERRKVDA